MLGAMGPDGIAVNPFGILEGALLVGPEGPPKPIIFPMLPRKEGAPPPPMGGPDPGNEKPPAPAPEAPTLALASSRSAWFTADALRSNKARCNSAFTAEDASAD